MIKAKVHDGSTMNKRAQTRERILQAAWHLFEQQGYEETSTRQIAKQAGVADGTVFSHFDNKLLILREGMLNQLKALSADMVEPANLTSDQNPILAMGMAFAQQYYGYYFANVNLSRALLKEVIWDMDYYESYNKTLFADANLPAAIQPKIPLILDAYFMTLITHLSKPEPDITLALKELESKYTAVLD